MLSSICGAETITELDDALYSLIRVRMANDYVVYRGKNNYKQLKIQGNKCNPDICKSSTSSILYRGLGSNNYDKIMSNPIEKSGRDKYYLFDMTFSNENINTNCETENNTGTTNHSSNAGSFTSFSSNPFISIKNYGKSFTVVYSIPKNMQKSYFSINTGQDEIIGFDIPIEYRVCSLIYKNANEVSDVKFSEKMDFVIFRLKLIENIEIADEKDNIITYKAGQNITIGEEELKKIILKIKDKDKLVDFFNNQLTIERVFDKNKILNNKEEQKIYENSEEYKYEFQKTLDLEERLERIEAAKKPFSKKRSEITENNVINNKIITYTIPDVHGSINAFKKDLIKTGLIIDDGSEEYIYYKKNDYRLAHPIYKKLENNTDYIKVPKLIINSDFKDRIVQLGDLVDNHSGEETEDSLACLATSILLSRQLGDKYTTLIGNHEIAHIAMDGYTDFKKNNECKNFIMEAIKNGEIKLFQHTQGTNIINSHVPLLRDNIINFLNTPIFKILFLIIIMKR